MSSKYNKFKKTMRNHHGMSITANNYRRHSNSKDIAHSTVGTDVDGLAMASFLAISLIGRRIGFR